MNLLLDNQGRARRVRLMLLGTLVWCLLAGAWSVDLWQHYGLSPGDGGVLRPVGQRIAMAITVALLGLLPLLGMLVYVRRYALRIERHQDTLHITVLGVLRACRRELPVSDVASSRYVEGRLRTWKHSVHAPWINLWVVGDWLPYIVDAQAGQVSRSALLGLGARRRPSERRGRG